MTLEERIYKLVQKKEGASSAPSLLEETTPFRQIQHPVQHLYSS